MTPGAVNGIVALEGGGPFVANDELDRRLLASVTASRVVVLPTADAFEGPDRVVAAALVWGERMGVEVQGLMVLRRADALDDAMAAAVRSAQVVYLVGDQPLHLRSVMKDTPTWQAIVDLIAAGGLVVAVGASGSAVCDPMVDPRGGAFTLGLGLLPGVAFVSNSDEVGHDRLHRTLELANTPVVCAPTGAAVVLRPDGWECVGPVEVHGDLPRPGPV